MVFMYSFPFKNFLERLCEKMMYFTELVSLFYNF